MSINIIQSELFRKYPGLVFGFSTKPGGVSSGSYCLNLSIFVGDDPDNVKQNRGLFFNELGIKEEEVTFQKQVHSSVIKYSDKPCNFDNCDGIYTNKKNNYLVVGVADCIPVFLYDPEKQVVAGVHSGWKGTHEKILTKMITKLQTKFNSEPDELIAFIGPGISQDRYEVGEEVGVLFDENIRYQKNEKFYLDLKKDNFNQLLKAGLKKENIEVNELCTYNEKELLHSYRRDGVRSGRMFGVIGMR